MRLFFRSKSRQDMMKYHLYYVALLIQGQSIEPIHLIGSRGSVKIVNENPIKTGRWESGGLGEGGGIRSDLEHL